MQKIRPVYLDLLSIRQPVTAITSILHRVAGVMMLLSLPSMIYIFDLSLRDPSGFHHARALLQFPLSKLLMTVLIYALVHHLLAGIRCLLLDLDLGIERSQARQSAWGVNVLSVLLTAVFTWGLWSCVV